MEDMYSLEDVFRAPGGGPYLDQGNPTLVSAEVLANKLGLDPVVGAEFVKLKYTPYEYEAEVEAEVEIDSELKGADPVESGKDVVPPQSKTVESSKSKK